MTTDSTPAVSSKATFARMPHWRRYVVGVCLVVLLVCAGVDAYNTVHHAGADFRPRVVGYRLLKSHQDPYVFRWMPGMSDRYIDPFLPSGLELTRTTVSPTTLLLQVPLEPLSYQNQRIAWLVVQWALLLAMVGLGWKWLTGVDRWVYVSAAVLFFAGAAFWRLHVERGQVYVAYAFVFACVALFARRRTVWGDVAAGLVLGVAIALRPPYVLVLIPLVIGRRWVLGAAGIVGAAAAAAVPLAYRSTIWQEYSRAMAAQGRQYLQYFGPTPPTADNWYPQVIEGRTFWSAPVFATVDAAVAKLATRMGIVATPARLELGLVIVIAGLVVAFWWAGRGRVHRVEVLLLQGGVLAYVAEFFLAGTRYSYRDIMLLPLLLLVLVVFGSAELGQSKWSWLGLAGLVLGCVGVTSLPIGTGGFDDNGVLMGEVFVTVSLIALTFMASRRDSAVHAAGDSPSAVRCGESPGRHPG